MTASESYFKSIEAQLVQEKFAPIATAKKLNAGKNNQTFLLELSDGSKFVLKRYHSHNHDLRNRLETEWRFLHYFWNFGIKSIPKPILKIGSLNSALYQYMQGRKLLESEITRGHIDEVSNFIIAINGSSKFANDFPPASEACFTISEHIESVERRVQQLRTLDASAPYKAEADLFVNKKLLPLWNEIRSKITGNQSHQDTTETLSFFISPSDFGFHNILWHDRSGLSFIDFEYSGRDDLAKLVNDFMCCPQIPVPYEYKSQIVNRIARELPVDKKFISRALFLERLYQVKWICIILNDFLAVGSARRDFSDGQQRASRCLEQLLKADQKFNSVQTNF
jgi:thiamine kinase-like enzyme